MSGIIEVKGSTGRDGAGEVESLLREYKLQARRTGHQALPLSFMRIAFFGGSFDPPHRGHLAVAKAAIRRLVLDRVWMAPAGAQPLKLGEAATSYADRLAMVELAVADEPGIVACDEDAPRSDGEPNFTIDVLSRIRAELSSQNELFFLLGADAFLSLREWRRAAELLFIAEFIVAGRPGFMIDDMAAALPEGVIASHSAVTGGEVEVVRWSLRNEAGKVGSLCLMPDLREDVSATDIRAAIAGEHSAAGVLAPAVLGYIEERGLYR
jgi:nicotinate-nucleotide adenylyltransferase